MFWYLVFWDTLILWWLEVPIMHSQILGTPFSLLLCEWTLLCLLCNMDWRVKSSVILMQALGLCLIVDNFSTFFVEQVYQFSSFLLLIIHMLRLQNWSSLNTTFVYNVSLVMNVYIHFHISEGHKMFNMVVWYVDYLSDILTR